MKWLSQRQLLFQKLNKFYYYFSFLFILVAVSCRPSDNDLVTKADEEALSQRSQLAKYLYIQVIQSRSMHDDIRFRALEGLAEISSSQLFDYPTAIKTIEKILEEYSGDAIYRSRTIRWRLRAAQIYRLSLQKYEKALLFLEPLEHDSNSDTEVYQEIGKNYLAIRKFKEAETFLHKAWDKAVPERNCGILKSLQLDLVQTLSLAKKCDQAQTWIQTKLPPPCVADSFSLAFEQAHCYEIGNDVSAAMKIYEEIIRKQPSNTRAYFLLEGIKRRQREKQVK
jgi:tetratricopeptide (TPR) repeat protein